ncbi:MAG: hypothetical protein AAGA30_07885, partial [Planctomycetota bacterium]
MRVKNQIRILYGLAAIIAAVGIAAGVIRVMSINDDFTKLDLSRDLVSNATDSDIKQREVISLTRFEPLWNKRLQVKPAVVKTKPPKAQTVAPKKPAPKPKQIVSLPEVNVKAILHSDSYSIATLSINGRQFSVAQGEVIDGVQ